MCLIVIAHRYHAQLPLVIAANRDEFHSRPTRDAHFWATQHPQTDLLAGQDLTQGGTWLGMSRDGRIAAVTNIRTPAPARGRRSRGFLTRDYLLGLLPAEDYLAGLLPSLHEYAGFNLLIGDDQGLFHLNSNAGQIEKLPPGIYGLSNSELDSDWPKVRRSKTALQSLLDAGENDIATGNLIAIMTDGRQAPDDQLPDTGIPLAMERQLSSSFIASTERGYGTRCTTAIVGDAAGKIRFCEQNYASDSRVASRRLFQFDLLDPAGKADQ